MSLKNYHGPWRSRGHNHRHRRLNNAKDFIIVLILCFNSAACNAPGGGPQMARSCGSEGRYYNIKIEKIMNGCWVDRVARITALFITYAHKT